MTFIDTVLKEPSYGWKNQSGDLIKPTPKQLAKEFFLRLNVFRDKKNWLSFLSWLMVLLLAPCLLLFIFKFFTFNLLIAAFIYGMMILGTHGTIWHHRYCTHRAYKFTNNFWRFVTQNLTIKIIPEEIYVISHHVHHSKSDQPGDPYNATGGFLYCFLADVNHQPIARNMSEKDYNRCVKLMKHTGVNVNTFSQYKKYGTLANPLRTIISVTLSWLFWYAVFYFVGGNALACTLFGAAGVWAVGVRTFNYEGHGKGKDKRQEGNDFNRDDMSVNQVWPGIVAGEWHNNHHLYPKSARSGFKPMQVDMAWYYIKAMHTLGAVSEYNDCKKRFYNEHFKKAVIPLDDTSLGKISIINNEPAVVV